MQFLPPESHDTLPIATPTRPIGVSKTTTPSFMCFVLTDYNYSATRLLRLIHPRIRTLPLVMNRILQMKRLFPSNRLRRNNQRSLATPSKLFLTMKSLHTKSLRQNSKMPRHVFKMTSGSERELVPMKRRLIQRCSNRKATREYP